MTTSVAVMPSRRFGVPVAVRWLLIGLPVLVLIAQTWSMFHELWMTSTTYSHGYLVLGLAGWMTVREVRRSSLAVGRPSWLGLTVLLSTAAVMYTARVVDVQVVEQLAVPALIVAALWAGGGWGLAKRFAIPAAYLVFAISVWGYLTEPLRAMTTVVVGDMARITGIPVHIVGNSIHIPFGTFEVEGGCSGLHYVIVGGALAAFGALTQYRRLLPRVALLGAAVGLSIVANWVRVYVIVLAGYITDMQHFLVTVDHYYFGWAVFAFMVLPLLIWSSRQPNAGLAEEGVMRSDVPMARLAPNPFRALIAPAVCIAVTAVVAAEFMSSRPVSTTPAVLVTTQLPAHIAGWRLDGAWSSSTRPYFVGADTEADGRYVSDRRELLVYAAGYARQSQGAELIYYENWPIPDRDMILSTERIDVSPNVDGRGVAVRSHRLGDREGRLRQVWVGYQVAGFPATRDWSAKAYQALGVLMGRQDAQVFVLSVQCETDCEIAARVLRETGAAVVPRLLDAISVPTRTHEGS